MRLFDLVQSELKKCGLDGYARVFFYRNDSDLLMSGGFRENVLEKEMNPGGDLERTAKDIAEAWKGYHERRVNNRERVSPYQQARIIYPMLGCLYDLLIADGEELPHIWTMSVAELYQYAQDVKKWKAFYESANDRGDVVKKSDDMNDSIATNPDDKQVALLRKLIASMK